jgi:hypothetical protein
MRALRLLLVFLLAVFVLYINYNPALILLRNSLV